MASTSINWIPVTREMPKIGDPDFDEGAVQTSVLFFWDGGVYMGWPLNDADLDDEDRMWEDAEFAKQFYGVTHWAYFNKPESPPQRGEV